MSQIKDLCVDCGSENCPCYLAATGDCLICSRLKGENCCDCNWTGVCVYNEYIQGGEKVNNPRQPFLADILRKEEFAHQITVFTLKVSKGFAIKCSIPGSYVFLKSPGAEEYYQTPISVMKSDSEQGTVSLAVQALSAKSKALCREENRLYVRGVYRNGIIGIRGVLKEQKPLTIFAKGIGFAPLALLIKRRAEDSNTVVYLDTDKISEEFIAAYMPKEYRGELFIRKLPDIPADKTFFAKNEERFSFSNTVVLASDYFIKEISKITPLQAYSNNFKICCGEGICGSCSMEIAPGQNIRMCKCHQPIEIR